jgi:hypothetical protein
MHISDMSAFNSRANVIGICATFTQSLGTPPLHEKIENEDSEMAIISADNKKL